MRVLSNVEFEKITEGQSPRLKLIAKERCKRDPVGFLHLNEIGDYSKVCEYSGDHAASQWLKNLAVLAKNGKIRRIRMGNTTWEDHVEQVRMLHTAKEIQFNIGTHIFVKDCGRYGSIADYNPDTKEYIVVLDPFQVKTYKKNDLQKVAEKAQIPSTD